MAMIDTCKRLVTKYPNFALGVCGACLMISPLPVFMNMKFLDEHFLSTNASLHRFHIVYMLVLRILAILGFLAEVSGACLITAAVIGHRRRSLRKQDQALPTADSTNLKQN